MKCFNDNSAKLHVDCKDLSKNMVDVINGKKGDGTGISFDTGSGGHDMKHGSGGTPAGAVFGIVFLIICVIGALGAAYYYRQKLQAAEAAHANPPPFQSQDQGTLHTAPTQDTLELDPLAPQGSAPDYAVLANIPGGLEKKEQQDV